MPFNKELCRYFKNHIKMCGKNADYLNAAIREGSTNNYFKV